MRCMVLLAVTATPALADRLYVPLTQECYCTDRTGARVEMGETICLQLDGRMFMAQCRMSLNTPIWREVSEGCLSSGLKLPKPTVDTGGVDTHI